MSIELLVLVVGDVLFLAGPDGGCFVDGFVPVVAHKDDGQRDVIRIGLDDLAQPDGIDEFVFALAQVQADGGASAFALGL